MRPLWGIVDFIRDVRRKMRFGDLSRAPITLGRVVWHGDALECDWIARPSDVWDSDLRHAQRDQNESLQALAHAITMRSLVFEALPKIERAVGGLFANLRTSLPR